MEGGIPKLIERVFCCTQPEKKKKTLKKMFISGNDKVYSFTAVLVSQFDNKYMACC